MKRAVVAASLASVVAYTTLAMASNTEEHRALMVAGQLMRGEGKLLRAREILQSCGSQPCDGDEPECTKIQQFCTARATEVEHELPSLRVEIHDDLGRPLPDATAEIGGRVARDGDVIELDPGRYVLRASWLGKSGTADVELQRGVRVGAARVVLDLRTTSTSRPVPWYVTALGATAGVALASFAGFATANALLQSSLDDCRPYCSWDQRRGYVASTVGTDVSLGVAVVATAAAVIAWVTRPTVTKVEHLPTTEAHR